MNKHDIGGVLFVASLCLAVLFIGLQVIAWIGMHIVKLRTNGQDTAVSRTLQRIAVVSTIAGPACFLLAGAIFVWLSN